MPGGEHEELHLLADLAVVALLGLLQHQQILVEHLLLREGDAIDARHLLALGVAAPEGSGHARYLDGLDGTRRYQVRAAAEVSEAALRISSDRSVLQVLVDVLHLVVLAHGLELLDGVGLRHLAAHHGLVFLGQLAHLGLDLREVVLRDHLAVCRHHVVEEAVLHSRTKSELYAGVQLLERLGQQVGRRVPERVLALVVRKLVEVDACILVDGAVELRRLAIDPARYNVAGESRRKALCDLKTRHTLLIRANRAVGESDFNHHTN